LPSLLDLTEPTSEEVRKAEALVLTDGFALALARFKKGLEAAGKLYEEESDRVGTQAAIIYTAQFLRDVPALGPGTLAPFSKLLGVFDDFDNGITPALFKAEAPAHRGPHPIDVQSLHAYAAGTMDLLMGYGDCGKEEASRHVFRKLRSLGIQVGNAGSSGFMTPAHWRENIKARDKRKDHDAHMHERFLVDATPTVKKLAEQGKSPDAIRRWLLDNLGRVIHVIRGKSI